MVGVFLSTQYYNDILLNMRQVAIIIFVLFGINNFVYAQIKGYQDLGVSLSNYNKQTTARSMSMKNAFGALGGDLSAIAINPAATAIFNRSSVSMTLGLSNKNLNSNFYGGYTENNHTNMNLSQLGGVLVFENGYELNKLNFAINYQINNEFKNDWTASGISLPTWGQNYFNSLDITQYNVLKSQKYRNISSGIQSEINFSMGADFEDSFFFGLSFSSHDFNLKEEATRKEYATNGANAYVDAYEYFWQNVKGEGFSLGIGFIYKPVHFLRLGLSYVSPTWYEVHEESNFFKETPNDFIGYYNVLYSADQPSYNNNFNKLLGYDYQMRTPSKFTGSFATVIDKFALISLDVIHQNFKGIKVNPTYEFEDVNNSINTSLKNTLTYNLGAELRIDKFSLRGGYNYTQNPYINAIDTDNLKGYSVGMGYKFGNYNFDIAYDYSTQTEYQDFYPEFNNINGAELSKNKTQFIGTLTYKF